MVAEPTVCADAEMDTPNALVELSKVTTPFVLDDVPTVTEAP